MIVTKTVPVIPTYKLDVSQAELDVIEAVLSQCSGMKSAGNRIAQRLHKFRTPRDPYTVKVEGELFTTNGDGIHFTPERI